jgi:hypothetical protein
MNVMNGRESLSDLHKTGMNNDHLLVDTNLVIDRFAIHLLIRIGF